MLGALPDHPVLTQRQTGDVPSALEQSLRRLTVSVTQLQPQTRRDPHVYTSPVEEAGWHVLCADAIRDLIPRLLRRISAEVLLSP